MLNFDKLSYFVVWFNTQENEAKEKKMKKKEMTRLINMVMLAEKSDPRITADKVLITSY